MNNRGVKLGNEYAAAFGKVYADTPKAVFAAVAFSMCFMNVEEAGADQAVKRFLAEWRCLHENGIVPQAPPKDAPDVYEPDSQVQVRNPRLDREVFIAEKELSDKREKRFIGWGIVGEPKPGVLVPGPAGASIDASGYNFDDYFDGDKFLGPDRFGVVPIFTTRDGLFPQDAVPYPHIA